MIVKSIRGRIQLWHTTLLAVLMAGLLSAFYFHEKEIREREFDQKLMAPLSSSIPHFGAEAGNHPAPGSRPGGSADMRGPGPNGRSGPMGGQRPMRGPGAMNGPEDMEGQRPSRGMNGLGPMAGAGSQGGAIQPSLAERQALVVGPIMDMGFYIASVTSAGEIVYSSPNLRDNISYPTDLIKQGRQDTFMRTENGYREAIHRGPPPTYSIVVIGAPTAIMYAELATLRWQLLGIGLAIVIVAYIVGSLLVSRSLMPIKAISETAAHIADGHLYDRIDISDTESELGQMGEVLNHTFEKLENAFDQQVRFTADASHELRTPVAVILAKCQFALRRDREPEKYKEALATCETSAQHIRNLTESLLELSKVDSGEFQILKRDSDLKDIGESSSHMLSTLADQKQIQLERELAPVSCNVDPDRIHQVAINLISNAIKYTGEGGTVCVKTYSAKDECFLEIRDTGSGIKEADIPNLFDRFYRVNSERSEDRRSTGLGLAISKAIILAHGGDILVSSELGKGSCFTVRLPA